jgi:hypothetical protein
MMGIFLYLLLLTGNEKIPYNLQGTIILKSLPHVVNLRANEEIRIGFIYGKTIKKDTLIDIVDLFKTEETKEKKIVTRGINISKGQEEWEQKVDVVIILPSVPLEAIKDIIKNTRKKSILSITMTEAETFVKAGVSMGIRLSKEGKPEIIINPIGLRGERIVFTPSFMKMVKFI